MMLVWLLIGCCVVSVAFFLPGNSVEAWPALDMAGAAAALYLIALLFYALRPPVPLRRRILTVALTMLVAAGVSVEWLGTKDTTSYSRETLLKIHGVIIRGIMQYRSREVLEVLQRFHEQKGTRKVSLAEVFKQKYPNAALGTNIYKPEWEGDSLNIFVTAMADSEISLLAYHPYSRGRSPDFVTYSGRKGTVQERFVLTEKGLRYESDN